MRGLFYFCVSVFSLYVLSVVQPVKAEDECFGAILSEKGQDILSSAVRATRKKNLDNEDYLAAIAVLDKGLTKRDELCLFDVATLLEVRAGYKLKLIPSDYPGTLQDLADALGLNALGIERGAGILATALQLASLLNEYELTAGMLENFLGYREELELLQERHNWYRLGAVRYIAGDFAGAREALEHAIFKPEFEPEIYFFILLNSVYFELGLQEERLDLVRAYASVMPEETGFLGLLESIENGDDGEVPRLTSEELNIVGIMQVNRNAVPIKKVPPEYPRDCKSRIDLRVQKRVVVEHEVTENGKTANVTIASSEASCLDRFALRAAQSWKYDPKLVNGKPYYQKGMRTVFIFILEEY